MPFCKLTIHSLSVLIAHSIPLTLFFVVRQDNDCRVQVHYKKMSAVDSVDEELLVKLSCILRFFMEVHALLTSTKYWQRFEMRLSMQ